MRCTLPYFPAPSKEGAKAADFEIKHAWGPLEEAREKLDPESVPFSARIASQCRDGAATEGVTARHMGKT